MEKTLVVMAAGMGSRFGGLKQITPIDDDGNFIIDYSVYDAKKAGFSKVVFVIKEENLEVFKETIGKRIQDKINVSYAFQKTDDIPTDFDFSTRIKPWGTVQAILCTRDFVKGSFAVINADDFYGYDAFLKASKFMDEVTTPFTYASIAYPFGVTKSLVGAVKRGVLVLDQDRITSIIESSIAVEGDAVIATPLNHEASFQIDINAPVSMNMFTFQNDVYTLLEEYFKDFFLQDEESILNGEALLPQMLEEYLNQGKITILNRPASSKWLGMTYQSDLEIVKNELYELKEQGEYPNHLWE